MKRLMLAGLLASAAIPAVAADMPLKAPPRAIEAVQSWTGFYAFGFGGYSWGRISPDDFNTGTLFGTKTGPHNPEPKGGVFGFGGGYLWQYGAWVGGVEVDYGFSNEKDNQSVLIATGTCGVNEAKCTLNGNLNSKIDALGSARFRAGYLILPNLLAYGTAGVGWGRSQVDAFETVCITGGACTHNGISFVAKPNLFGWVAGGGVEFKLLEHVRLRGEYLHYDFGATGYAFQPVVTINAKTRDDVARGALIFNF